MIQNQINIDGSQLTISTRKTPIFLRVFLIFILTILILIPIALTFIWLTNGRGLHIGIAFSFILCWGIGFYLLRITLWNTVGREILNLNLDNISYIADYGLFRDGQQIIGLSDLETEIIFEDSIKNPVGRLRLTSRENSLETKLQATIKELEVVRDRIKTHYNTRL